MSAKRAKENQSYLKVRKLYLENNAFCEVYGCKDMATEIHHTYSGKDRNAYYLDASTWMAVCRQCHNNIHANPIESRKLGYLK